MVGHSETGHRQLPDGPLFGSNPEVIDSRVFVRRLSGSRRVGSEQSCAVFKSPRFIRASGTELSAPTVGLSVSCCVSIPLLVDKASRRQIAVSLTLTRSRA